MKDILSRLSSWHLRCAYKAQLAVFCKTHDGTIANIELVKRLERAYDILTKDEQYSIAYVPRSLANPAYFVVESPNDRYVVTPSDQTCSCPDSAQHGRICKHRLAIKLCIDAGNMMKQEGVSV